MAASSITHKVCKKCNENKLLSAYYKNSRGNLMGNCKRCIYLASKNSVRLAEYRRAYMPRIREIATAYRRRKRAEAMALLGGKCTRCGFADPRALQFDHINGGGVADIRKFSTNGARKVLKDSSRFQLLCANCNWIKRAENNEHGGAHPKCVEN